MKKLKLFKSHNAKALFSTMLLYIIIIIVWIWFFDNTADATPNNTYVETIKAIKIEKIGYPILYRNVLFVHTDNDVFTMNLGGDRTDIIEKVLLTEEKTVEVTIREHLPQYVLYCFKNIYGVKQIVNIQDGDTTVWSIEKHNSIQRTQRICGWIGLSFTTIVLVLMSLLWGKVTFFEAIKRKCRRYKKKQKKKKLKQKLNSG